LRRAARPHPNNDQATMGAQIDASWRRLAEVWCSGKGSWRRGHGRPEGPSPYSAV